MTTYITRAQWGARPPDGATALVPSDVLNIAFHWPGSAKAIDAGGDAGFARICSALRGWQDYHMDVRGWSDIAYQTAIDQAGRAYTLRGINIKSAANGGTYVNLHYGAILLVLGPGEEPSPAMLATARAVMADYRRRYSAIPNRPTWHGAIRPGGTADAPSTDCPGPSAIAAIKAGLIDEDYATAPTTPPPPKDDEMTIEEFADYVGRLMNPAVNGTLGKWHEHDVGWQNAMLAESRAQTAALDRIATAIKALTAAVTPAAVTPPA